MTAFAPILRGRTLALPLTMAGALAALVWVMVDPAEDAPMARALLAAGFILWSWDCITQARHAVTPERLLADPHRWTHAAFQAASIAAVLLLVVGDMRSGILGALIAAALVAFFWLAFPGRTPAAEPHWDTARPVTADPLRRRLYHLWPALSLALLAGLLAVAQPAAGSVPVYVLFQAAFLPFLLPLYPSKGRFLATAAERLRIGGLILLLAGVWIGTA